MHFQSCAFSLMGAKHVANEDGCVADDVGCAYVVADGVGRYRGAAVASRLAVEAAVATLATPIPPDAAARRNWLTGAARLAVTRMNAEAAQTPAHKDMRTALLLVLFAGEELAVLHVGDCRLYRFRDGQLAQLTNDHTVAWEQFACGAITKEQLRTHGNQKLLTRCLGPGTMVVAEIRFDQASPGDRLLLCSDGLIKALSDAELAEAFASTTVAAALAADLQARLGSGPLGDDTTAVAVDVMADIGRAMV